MSNKLEQVTTTDPYGNSSDCGKFTVDSPTTAFLLSKIATVGQTYTFNCWVRSNSASSVSVNGLMFPSTTGWTQRSVTFVAEAEDVPIVFGNTGTYYIYHPKLERGNKPTDWTPAPEDVYLDITSITVGGRNYILQSGEEQTIAVAGSTVYLDLPFSDELFMHAEEMMASFDMRYESDTDALQWGFYFRNEALSKSITERSGTSWEEMGKEYTRYTYPIRYVSGYGPEDLTQVRFAFRGGTGTVYIKNIKLETGNKPTDWTPAPEDLEQGIADARSYFEQTHSGFVLAASETYVKQEDYEAFKSETSTEFTLVPGKITAEFEKADQRITDVDGSLQTIKNSISKHIEFSSDNAITIGGSSGIVLTVDNDNGIIFSKIVSQTGTKLDDSKLVSSAVGYQVSTANSTAPTGEWLTEIPKIPSGYYLWIRRTFVYDDESTCAIDSVAFGSWDGNDFYTGNIVVRLNERAQLGNFAFVPRSDGSLSFLKVGG